ncbi:MAG: hypothetical protein ABJA57_12615 [Ginsengibacter sp.]
MKKSILTVLCFILITFSFAQVDTVKLKDIQKNTHVIITDRPPQAVYFQVGGSAPLFSVNYDRRFAKRVNGAGFAIGVGYYGESGSSIFSIPASLNYLFGKSNHFIELAAGATYISEKETLFGDNNTSLVFFHVNAGYRYQPTKGGFFFRGGFSPLFAEGEFVTSFYLGFGHNF